MADRKQMKADRDEYEQFVRAAGGLNTKGPGSEMGPTAPYMPHRGTSRDLRDITARELSGKHPGVEATKIAPRNPRDPKAKG
jgi:hypothetical protein